MPIKKNSGLGRGLDAIFLENTLDKEAENGANKINLLNNMEQNMYILFVTIMEFPS